MGAPGGLAVDGNEIVAVWPQRGDPALEAASEQERVDAVDEGAQPARAGDAVVEGREAAQNGEVVRAPGNDVVAGGDGRAGDQEQHLMEGVEHAPRLAGIVEGGELFQEQAQAVARQVRAGTDLADVGRKGVGVAGAGGHGRAPCRIRSRHGNTPSVSYHLRLISSGWLAWATNGSLSRG